MNSINQSVENQFQGTADESAAGRNRDSGGLTKLDSFLQIFCLFQGTCFFLFPGYFKDVGMLPGIVLGFAIPFAYLYLVNLYFWSNDQLKALDPSLGNVSLYNLVELVFARIGQLPRLGLYLKLYLKYEIILSWLCGMSFSLLFICKCFKLVLANFGYYEEERTILLWLSLPLAFTCFAPNLAALNKAFYVSNAVVIVIVVETFYFIFINENPWPKIEIFGSLDAIPTYMNNIIFTICMTPLIFLYRDEMKREKDFTSLFGSLNVAICTTIFVYIIYSVSCYVRYGSIIDENIIKNLPNNSLTNVACLVMTIVMIVSGSAIFYGIFQCLWEGTLDTVFGGAKHVEYYKFATKLIMYIFIISVTAVVPSLDSFLNLLCSFSVPYDSLLLPVALETVIVCKFSKSKFKKFLFLVKNIILMAIALVIAVWSFTSAVLGFLKLGDQSQNVSSSGVE